MGFHERKTTQAAAWLLNLAQERMPAPRLILLLYLVDREALLRWSWPVTGDTYSSTRHGPALDYVSQLLATPDLGEYWSQHISTSPEGDVTLNRQPGHGKLSEAEEELIVEIYARFRLFDQLHHDQLFIVLPEWSATDVGQAITYADILRTDQRSPEEINDIEDEIAAVEYAHRLFGAG